MLPERNTAVGNLLDSTRGLNVAGAARTMIELMPPFEMPTGLSFMISDASKAEQIWGKPENRLSPEAGIFLAIEAAKGNMQQLEIGKRYVIVMEPIDDPYPLPNPRNLPNPPHLPAVFELIRDRGGVWLTTRYIDSDTQWDQNDVFVTRTSKQLTFNL